MVIWIRKSIWSSQKISNYLEKKIKSGDFAKHCMVLSVRGYSEATQDMLDISGRGILSKSNI